MTIKSDEKMIKIDIMQIANIIKAAIIHLA